MHLGLIARSPFVMDALEHWAIDAGFALIEKSGLLVLIEGDLKKIEDAFRVKFHQFDHGWHTDDTPTLPSGAVAVSGLSTKGRLYSHARAHKLDNPVPPLTTNGPRPGLTPSQVLAAYGVSGSADGSGQTMGIAAWGQSYQQSDIDQFCQDFHIPSPNITEVPISGYTAAFNAQDGPELTLDICWALAMAPHAAIRIYNAPGGTSDASWGLQVTALLNAVLTDSISLAALNISYGDGEDQFLPSDLTAWEHLISEITKKGTVVVVSSGDQGAYGLHALQQPQIPRACAPASCPSALAVGATALYMNDLTVEDEWAWSNDLNDGATGGGYSTVFARPNYQDGLSPQPAMRGVPDMAALGAVDTEALLYYDGQYLGIAGTSLSAPIVAGIIARLTPAKGSGLGDIHAVLYQHGPTLCRDITVGNNNCFAVTGFYAEPGWDPVTGWGSPIYPQWLTLFGKGGAPVTPIPTVNPATLSVSQLAQGHDGAYGAANIPLQQDARTVQTALQSANFFGLCHRPTGYFNTAQEAAARLWQAGVRH